MINQWSVDVSFNRLLDAGTYYLAVWFNGSESEFVGDITARAVMLVSLNNILQISLNNRKAVNITERGQVTFFSYTPEDTGYYTFESFGNTDTYGDLYDENLSEITRDDDSGEDNNFRISRKLTAGTTYYFGARYNSPENTGTFDVQLAPTQGLLDADAEQSYFTVEPNTEVTLQVNAVCTDRKSVV